MKNILLAILFVLLHAAVCYGDMPMPVIDISCDELPANTAGISIVEGKCDKAYLFDGGFYDTKYTRTPEQITVSCWVCFDRMNDKKDRVLISKGTGSDSGFILRYNDPYWGMTAEIFNGENTDLINYTQVDSFTWYHVAFTIGNGKFSSYFNGVCIQSVPTKGMKANDLPILIGTATSGALRIDNVRIYDRALSEEQIRAIWDKDWRDYSFDGSISEAVLNSYLSRAVTSSELLIDKVTAVDVFIEHVEMLSDIGAKFLGRASLIWGGPASEVEDFFRTTKARAAYIHKIDPEIILQAAILECIHPQVEDIAIPAWVFKAFDLPVEQRNFNYDAMYFDTGGKNFWHKGASLPDMTKIETQMWFYYAAVRYIDSGIEAFHMGQVMLMGRDDKEYRAWQSMLEKVRKYAKTHARRHFVLMDAHSSGIICDGVSIFDFNSYPMRMKYAFDSQRDVILEMCYRDSIYKRSKHCKTPSGWQSESLPYIVEFDNWDKNLDEITLFSKMPKNYRDKWVRYAWEWVRVNDPVGWLQPCTLRICGGSPDGMYNACDKSSVVKYGFGDWRAIKDLFDGKIGEKEPPRLEE